VCPLRSPAWQIGRATPTPTRPQRVQHRGNVTKQSTAWPRTYTSASARSNTPTPLLAPARRRTPAIHGAAGIARISGLVRRLWAGLVLDGLASGNHGRGRVGATPGGGAQGAHRCATSGGGWGPRHTGNVGAAHRSRPFALGRFSPRAPAPAAPRLPGHLAMARSTRRENGPSLRRSPPPATAGQH
jgi:hypothetical protein